MHLTLTAPIIRFGIDPNARQKALSQRLSRRYEQITGHPKNENFSKEQLAIIEKQERLKEKWDNQLAVPSVQGVLKHVYITDPTNGNFTGEDILNIAHANSNRLRQTLPSSMDRDQDLFSLEKLSRKFPDSDRQAVAKCLKDLHKQGLLRPYFPQRSYFNESWIFTLPVACLDYLRGAATLKMGGSKGLLELTYLGKHAIGLRPESEVYRLAFTQ